MLLPALAVLLGACGSRSNLKAADPCFGEGEQRACSDVCGQGIQTCEGGYWQPCRVPVQERPCANSCGEGSQRCENAAWTECVVEPVVAPCENDCGTGQQVCENDSWGACEVEPVARTCATACGDGLEWCRDGRWLACDAPAPRPPKLKTVVRDLLDTHPDFESPMAQRIGRERDAVLPQLGSDDKPERNPSSRSILSDESFYSWYHDVEGVNQSTPIELQLEESSSGNALFEYRNNEFFPIDDELLGNQGRRHNFHFTLEAATEFRYVGGEVFIFTGDDDLWVFINRRLAIDLGGLHTPLRGEVKLDEVASEFGLELGEIYPLHIFFAERHTVDSNFTIETSIAGPPECD